LNLSFSFSGKRVIPGHVAQTMLLLSHLQLAKKLRREFREENKFFYWAR
jgi:hypothetical protein